MSKIMTAGEGGMITTDDATIHRRAAMRWRVMLDTLRLNGGHLKQHVSQLPWLCDHRILPRR
jgi:hypothetical protein